MCCGSVEAINAHPETHCVERVTILCIRHLGLFWARTMPGPPQAGSTMKHTKSTTETLVSLVESALQARAINGFGLTGPALLAAVQRGQPYPELEQAYLELLAGDDAGTLALDPVMVATGHKVFQDLLQSFTLIQSGKTEPTGKALVAAVRAYDAHMKEPPAVSDEEHALYLLLDTAMKRTKKRAA